jgi:hypothetical protein
LGYAFVRIGQRKDRLARIRAYRVALAAEVNLCEHQARTAYRRRHLRRPPHSFKQARFALASTTAWAPWTVDAQIDTPTKAGVTILGASNLPRRFVRSTK